MRMSARCVSARMPVHRQYSIHRRTLTSSRRRRKRSRAMIRLVMLLLGAVRALVRQRSELVLENLALRQQVAVLAAKGGRARITTVDRWFWIALRRCWSRWTEVLVFVKPETVVRWHRAGFRRYWTWLTQRGRRGRPRTGENLCALIRRMATENAGWGAPRIHGELLKLGFDISERTVSRYLPRRPVPPDALKRWLTFLRNHRDAIAAMDLFVVPTATFRLVYAWFAIGHNRRHILHFDVTDQPTAAWVVQQLRETFGLDVTPRHMIFDRDSIFSAQVVSTVKSFGIQPTRTAYRCPWQNGVAERWVGSVRRELLDHVVVLSERHLRRLLGEYVAYYHEDRTHLGLNKDTPGGRSRAAQRGPHAAVLARSRLGGLHHRYDLAA
jgi:putative transposase